MAEVLPTQPDALRARSVAIARGDLDAAAEHLRFARAHASWSGLPRWMQLIAIVDAEFASKR